jgi:hypothetical protein
MAMLDSTTDRTATGAAPDKRELPGLGHPAGPGPRNSAELAAGVALRPGGPENP